MVVDMVSSCMLFVWLKNMYVLYISYYTGVLSLESTKD